MLLLTASMISAPITFILVWNPGSGFHHRYRAALRLHSEKTGFVPVVIEYDEGIGTRYFFVCLCWNIVQAFPVLAYRRRRSALSISSTQAAGAKPEAFMVFYSLLYAQHISRVPEGVLSLPAELAAWHHLFGRVRLKFPGCG